MRGRGILREASWRSSNCRRFPASSIHIPNIGWKCVIPLGTNLAAMDAMLLSRMLGEATALAEIEDQALFATRHLKAQAGLLLYVVQTDTCSLCQRLGEQGSVDRLTVSARACVRGLIGCKQD